MEVQAGPTSLPAIHGGTAAFPEGLPLARPRFPDPAGIGRRVERIVRSHVLTDGPLVRELESRAAEYLGVRHCVAVASCTAGLTLVLRAAEISGDVVIPSFTFAATAHAVSWNGLRPVFADVDPDSLNLSPDDVQRVIGVRVSAILATHLYGTPCDVEGLQRVATRNGVALFFDAAHAFGSRRAGVMVGGFGAAEVFSLTPTKMLVGGEGGIIATNDDLLAERCRIGRNYGNPGDYDCRFIGLNGRMSELHAAVALASFEDLEERIERRNVLADRFRARVAALDGVSVPLVGAQDRSTFKDLVILVDEAAFGLSADDLATGLAADGIETRRYYSPPAHRMRAYRSMASGVDLPITDEAARSALALPLWPDMRDEHVDGMVDVISNLQRHASIEGRRNRA